MKIKTKVTRIENKIKMLHEELQLIRDNCPHDMDVEYKYRSNTGNWSSTDDSYWIEWKCNECGKTWITDQSYESRLHIRVMKDRCKEIK